MSEYLMLEECKHGYAYLLDSRNFTVGVCMIEPKGLVEFLGLRYSYGDTFLSTEDHWDTPKHLGTAKPLKELEKVPDVFNIGFKTLDGKVNKPLEGYLAKMLMTYDN